MAGCQIVDGEPIEFAVSDLIFDTTPILREFVVLMTPELIRFIEDNGLSNNVRESVTRCKGCTWCTKAPRCSEGDTELTCEFVRTRPMIDMPSAYGLSSFGGKTVGPDSFCAKHVVGAWDAYASDLSFLAKSKKSA